MEYKDVLDTMTGEYNNLTKSGRKAADYIFAHRVEAQYMSITALAEECGVAEATISRFCRTLGFSGYNDFKLALAKASGAPAADDEVGIYGKVLPEDSITDMCKKLYATNVAGHWPDAGADRRGECGPGSEISFRRTAGLLLRTGGKPGHCHGGMGAFHYSRTPVPVHRGLPHAGHGRGALHAGRCDPVFFLFRRDKGYAGCAAPGAQTRRKDHPGDAFCKVACRCDGRCDPAVAAPRRGRCNPVPWLQRWVCCSSSTYCSMNIAAPIPP